MHLHLSLLLVVSLLEITSTLPTSNPLNREQSLPQPLSLHRENQTLGTYPQAKGGFFIGGAGPPPT